MNTEVDLLSQPPRHASAFMTCLLAAYMDRAVTRFDTANCRRPFIDENACGKSTHRRNTIEWTSTKVQCTCMDTSQSTYSTQTDKLIGILVCSVRGCGNDVATLASNNGLSPCSEIPSPYTQRLQTRQQTVGNYTAVTSSGSDAV